jgi:hypothetical protein
MLKYKRVKFHEINSVGVILFSLALRVCMVLNTKSIFNAELFHTITKATDNFWSQRCVRLYFVFVF